MPVLAWVLLGAGATVILRGFGEQAADNVTGGSSSVTKLAVLGLAGFGAFTLAQRFR